MKSPSGWHDNAAERDAGHDEMQAAVLREWREGKALSWLENDKLVTSHVVFSKAEYPLLSDGRLRGFADVAVQFEYQRPRNYPPETTESAYGWRLFELSRASIRLGR